jgi:Co/Zn/Cd efflux system component
MSLDRPDGNPPPRYRLQLSMDTAHRHGRFVHSHLHAGKHRHLALLLRSSEPVEAARDSHDHDGYAHDEHGDHGHSHGLVDPSIVRSRSGIRAVSWSLAILTVTALAQTFIYSQTLSVALLADLIHNFGDALTAIPLGIAFYLRSARGERWAGLAVVLAIFISALVALGQTIERFINPRSLSHLWLLAAAGVIGFIGNEIAAQVRLRAGRRLHSPALVADGNHARVDGFVSIGVVASAAVVALGLPIADPLIGFAITLVILKITWDSWRRVRAAPERHFELS